MLLVEAEEAGKELAVMEAVREEAKERELEEVRSMRCILSYSKRSNNPCLFMIYVAVCTIRPLSSDCCRVSIPCLYCFQQRKQRAAQRRAIARQKMQASYNHFPVISPRHLCIHIRVSAYKLRLYLCSCLSIRLRFLIWLTSLSCICS